MPEAHDLECHIAAVRRFTRFYTRRIGLLQQGDLLGPYTLAQARVLYELAHRDRPTATELAQDLGLDHGYLSRILRGFVERGFVARKPSSKDGRQSLLRLTAKGRGAFTPLDQRSHDEVAAMLGKVGPPDQARLVDAMATIEKLLGAARKTPAYVLRPHRPGDMGWVVSRHGTLYAEEYGWDVSFEGLVAGIVADFIKSFDAKCERCWIAEMNGEPVGSVFVVRKTDEVAKLRLLIVDPKARGLGIGAHLVEECLSFARACGYRAMTLWTQDNLTAARRIYEGAGFRRTAVEPHHSFGVDLVGETWERDL